jgi:signal transduction histidine kinase
MPLPRFNWLTRWLGFAWVGVLTLGLHPARGAALEVQAAGYVLAALAMLGWFLVDHDQRVARHRDRALPMLLGLIASASGCAAAAGGAGTFLLCFGFVATMVAGSDASRTAAFAVTAAAILASEIGALAFGGGYSVIVGFPLAMASGLLTGRNRAAYRLQARQSAMLLAQSEQLAAEHRRADLLDERARIAREIHDVLAHSLGALSIQVQAARSVLTDRGDIPAATELLAAAQRMTAEGLVETRRAISALRADTLPLEEELASATATYADRYQVAVAMETTGTPRPAPPDVTVALLRVAQEALVNAAKHAPGQPVTVRLVFGPADICLTVRNDITLPPDRTDSAAPPATADSRDLVSGGASTRTNAAAGIPASTGVSTADTGYGLTSMRERLRLLSGTLDAGLADGQWTVAASLPLVQPAIPDEPRPEKIAQ